MTTRRTYRRGLATALAVLTTGLVTVGAQAPLRAAPAHIDPATLPRGPNPAVAYMVDDTIVDGSLRIHPDVPGKPDQVWTTSRGYVVRVFGERDRSRLVFVGRGGSTRIIARSTEPIDVAVSPNGRRLVWAKPVTQDSLRKVVRILNPNTGRLLASRRQRLVTVVGVTGSRVLLGHRLRWRNPETTWWNYRRDTTRKLYDQAAVGVDVRNDRIVFDRGSDGEFCNRVARLSRPAETLWRSCRIYPHQWSPNGAYAVATDTYFDAAGTYRWLTIDGSTGVRLGRVFGRLDWDAVWEDNRRFLTLAQSDNGKAAVIRCTISGRCQRASRLWLVPVPEDPSVYYAPPPVVLSSN